MSLRRPATGVVTPTLHVQHPKLPAVEDVGALYRTQFVASAVSEGEWRDDLKALLYKINRHEVPAKILIRGTNVTIAVDFESKKFFVFDDGKLLKAQWLKEPYITRVVEELATIISRKLPVTQTEIEVLYPYPSAKKA